MTSHFRVLVTGANGLIGSHILYQKREGFELISSTRKKADKHYLDLENLDQIQVFLDEVKPDCIVNCAGITSIQGAAVNPYLTEILNVQAVSEMARWCSKNRARLIQFSTDFVYEGDADFYSESDSTNPLSIYGESKLKSEQVAFNENENTVVIRTSLVYGYLDNLSRSNFPLFLKAKLDLGETLRITADQYRSPTYAGDLASAVLELVKSNFKGVLNVAGPERISVFDFALRVCEAFSLDESLLTPVNTETEENENCRRPLSTGLNIRKAHNIIQFTPLDVREGLRKMGQFIDTN